MSYADRTIKGVHIMAAQNDETRTGSDFLDQKLVEIRERIEELRPLRDEYTRLEAAEAALAGVPEEPKRRGGRRATN